MNYVPNDMILLIFDNITTTLDKRNFTRTCKTYNNITKQLMANIKYIVFKITATPNNYPKYDLISVCDTLNDCHKHIISLNYKIKYPAFKSMNKENNYTIMIQRSKNKNLIYYPGAGFIIEEIIINKIIQ